MSDCVIKIGDLLVLKRSRMDESFQRRHRKVLDLVYTVVDIDNDGIVSIMNDRFGIEYYMVQSRFASLLEKIDL